MSDDFASHFSDRNIPFGIASSKRHAKPQAVTRLGNTVIFLNDLAAVGLFKDVEGLEDEVFNQKDLNKFAALPKPVHRAVRETIQHKFRKHDLDGFTPQSKEEAVDVNMHMPVEVRDFSDFSCSLFHVKNAGRIIAKSSDAPPSFYKFPIGYQGRASSIVVSGTDIERPLGHFWDSSESAKSGERKVMFGPSEKFDYELEFAAVIGKPLPMRQRLRATEANDHIFGFVILNDWSARDIQGFEMTPLGPFSGKSSGTSVSPWIVTLDALEPFKINGSLQGVPESSYLYDPNSSTYAINFEVEIMAGKTSTKTATSQLSTLFWTPRQMIAHAVSSGSALRIGDMLATGTISGSSSGTHGCLLETTEGGTIPITMNDGSERRFLNDGDVVRMSGFAGELTDGVGFGECRGRLTASRPF